MSVTPRTIPPATHAPPSVARSGGPPPGAPPGTGFDEILALQSQARTAPAEGRTGQTDTPTGAVDDQDATQRDAVPGEEPGTVSDPAAAVEPEVPTEAPVPTPDAAGASQVDIQVLPSEAETSTTTTDPAATAAGSPVPVLEGSGTAQPGVEAPATAITGASSPMPEAPVAVLEGTGTEAGPATGQEAAATVAASAPEPSETPASPAAATTSPGVDSAAAAKAGPKPEATATQRPAAGDQPKQQGGEQTGSSGQPATPAAAAPAPAPQAAPPAAAPPAHAAAQPQTAAGAPMLPGTVHRMQALVDFAVRKGHAQAHLELHPAELGQVNVRLRSAAGGGLTATMTVDRPEALQALQAAADQLRQSLEDQGVEVARLDIGLSAQARGDEARTGAREDGRDASGGIARRRGTDAADPDHDDPDLAPATVRPLNPGALVDVQA